MSRSAILSALASWLTPDGNGNVLASQSPAQLDNSTKLITSAWVNTRGVAYAGQTVINAATTLTLSNVGRLNTITSAVVATLPAANSVSAGTLLHMASTVGGASVSRQGADVIAVGNGASTPTVSLGAGDTLVLMSDGVANWIAIGGSTQLGSSAAFGSSLASSGYQKLPSGLIVEWGLIGTNSSGTTATFPLAFPSVCYAVALGQTGTAIPANCYVAMNATSTTGFTVSASGAVPGVFYIAIGK